MDVAAPRQHHILPVFYLAGFTDTGSADGRLHVFDYFQDKHYTSSPRRVCRQRDFYRIAEPGVDPNIIEKDMADLEQLVAPVLQRTREAGRVRHAKDVGALLSLAALIAARNRRARYQLSSGLSDSLRRHLAAGNIGRAKWDKIRGSQRRYFPDADELPEYDRAVALSQEEGWVPPAPEILKVGLIPEAQESILLRLQDRRWEAMATDWTSNGGFIASDSPLVWGSLEQLEDQLTSLQDPDLEITFPISRSLALVSYPGARHRNCGATDAIVAHVNMRTLQLSMGLVFHPAKEFLLRRANGQIGPASNYFQCVTDARSRGVERP
jgi:hypothetical protein